jgi:hypothetical protein
MSEDIIKDTIRRYQSALQSLADGVPVRQSDIGPAIEAVRDTIAALTRERDEARTSAAIQCQCMMEERDNTIAERDRHRHAHEVAHGDAVSVNGITHLTDETYALLKRQADALAGVTQERDRLRGALTRENAQANAAVRLARDVHDALYAAGLVGDEREWHATVLERVKSVISERDRLAAELGEAEALLLESKHQVAEGLEASIDAFLGRRAGEGA